MLTKSLNNTNIFYYLIISVLFCIFCYATPIAPLYSYNQNTYFLHGLAAAGFGQIQQDWFITSKDSFPLFSKLVKYTYLYLTPSLFNFYFCLIKGVFFISLLLIVKKFFLLDNLKLIIFSVILITINSIAFDYYTEAKIGYRLKMLINAGFANQSMLSTTFQPSEFGVFLLLGICLFIYEKRFLAIISCGIAASFHSSYILHGLLLIISFSISRREINFRSLLVNISLYSILCLPSIIYIFQNFLFIDHEVSSQAQSILVNQVIPQHAKVNYFFSEVEIIQLLIMICSLYILRTSRYYRQLFIATLLVLLLSIVQYLSGSNFLALLFPWRLTTILVPLFTSFVIAVFIKKIPNEYFSPKVVLILTMSVTSITLYLSNDLKNNRIEFFNNRQEERISKYVLSLTSSSTYMVPSTFYEFRLDTGKPVFVDQKNHPYDSPSVIEWHERLQNNNDFYENPSCEKLTTLSTNYQIESLIIEAKQKLSCIGWEKNYCDINYCLLIKTSTISK